MKAANEDAVGGRVAALIARFGYEVIRASVEKQKPPAEPSRPGPKGPHYNIDDELPFLRKVKELWEADGKPISAYPYLNKVGAEMRSIWPMSSAKSHADRLNKRLRTADEIWLIENGLMGLAAACGHWFPFMPLPDQLIEQHRHDLIKLQNVLCRFLIDKASSLPSGQLNEQISDLLDIVKRRENWREMIANTSHEIPARNRLIK